MECPLSIFTIGVNSESFPGQQTGPEALSYMGVSDPPWEGAILVDRGAHCNV